MRAKYISKTARRRTIRPDGDHYREMRKWRGDPRNRRLRRIFAIAITIAVAILAYYAVRWFFFR